MRHSRARRTTSVAALAAALALLAPVASATTASAGPPHARHDRTRPSEAARVDRVPTPDPGWQDCSADAGPGAECGSVTVPLDYDTPQDGTTQIALVRFRATDPDRRVGTLFVNPGGPGGSGVGLAVDWGQDGPPGLRERFDLVGFDPRGTNGSTNVSCFVDSAQRRAALPPGLPALPQGPEQEAALVASAQALGRACATTGAPLSAAVSTAQVARDLDVLRRAVGDERLTYLGFSYGTYLGNVYANMFPDRVRAIVLDAVVDPHAWRGDGRAARTPTFVRTGAHESSAAVLTEVLVRCRDAGPDRCRTAGLGDPVAVYDAVATGLRAAPLEVTDPATGQPVGRLGLGEVLATLQGSLARRGGGELPQVDRVLWSVHQLQQAPTEANAADRAEAGRALADLVAEMTPPDEMWEDPSAEAYYGVLCSDGRQMARPQDAARVAARADAEAPGFGALMAWAGAPCAESTWTARDEDAWTGPFDRRTAAPVLVVGSLWDPSTGFHGARAVARELPGSGLLTSDSWGHISYGTSACATDHVDAYLVTGALPPRGTVCTGDARPFTEPWAQAWQQQAEPEVELAPLG